jgi:hypothetical protein
MKAFIKTCIFICSICFITSCINSPIGFRSVIHFHNQHANGEGGGVGYINGKPTTGNSNVEAPKTTSDSFNPSTSMPLLQTGTSDDKGEIELKEVINLTNKSENQYPEEPYIELPEIE